MPQFIPITQGMVAVVDDCDYARLAQYSWQALRVKRSKIIYAKRSWREGPKNRFQSMHRAVLNAPPEFRVDHINGDGLDNQRKNLRLSTHAQNLKNQKIRQNQTGFKGVSAHGLRFRARIKSDYKERLIGVFDTAEEAAHAYDAAATSAHGEFARTNKFMGLL